MDSLNINNVPEGESAKSMPESAPASNTRMMPEAVPASLNKAMPQAVASAPAPTPQVVATAPAPTPQVVTHASVPQVSAPQMPTAPVAQMPAAPTAPSSVAQMPAALTVPSSVAQMPTAPIAQAPAAPASTPQMPANPVPQASASQVAVTPATQPAASAPAEPVENVIKPAFNSSVYNPMPEIKVPAEKADDSQPVNKVSKANTAEENNSENKKEKKKKQLGIGPMIAICAAVGLLVSVIGTVGLFLLQSKTNVLDKLFTAQGDEADTGDDSVETDPDATDPDAADPNATDPDAVIDTAQTGTGNTGTSANSFNTNYTTVITGSSDVITVTENAMPSMVTIIKEFNYIDSSILQYFSGYTQGQNYVVEASGSGVIIAETDSEFLIVSNNHVVENPISLTLTFVDGTSASGYIKGCDKSRDLAIVAVLKDDVSDETVDKIRIASIGDSRSLKLGEQVVAIGNALGYGQSVTTGIVSALDREMETEEGNVNKFIQTDAAINPGNSGGALLNMAGQLIGINSNKIAESSVEGMGYAIPISDVTDIIEELMEHSTKIPLPDDEVGYIGINLQEVTQALSDRFSMPVGIYIVETIDGGAAEAAGLQTGDIITKFDGETITSYDELDRILKCYAAGTKVTITYQRQENGVYVEHTTELTLGSKP